MLGARLRAVWIWAVRRVEAHPGIAVGVLVGELLKDVLFSIFWDRVGPSVEAFIDKWTVPVGTALVQWLIEFLLIPGSVFVLALIILLALSWWETRLPRPGPTVALRGQGRVGGAASLAPAGSGPDATSASSERTVDRRKSD